MIRPATKQDVNTLLKLTKACAIQLISEHIFQWNDTYPNRSAFENDINRNELYVYLFQNNIIGCIVISNFMDTEYNSVNWLTPNKNNIYIHRLAIHPKHQGRGFAKELMDFAETKAKQQNALSIRLDTFSLNPRNLTFYKTRGYTQLGSIYFPKQSKAPFYCFELVL